MRRSPWSQNPVVVNERFSRGIEHVSSLYLSLYSCVFLLNFAWLLLLFSHDFMMFFNLFIILLFSVHAALLFFGASEEPGAPAIVGGGIYAPTLVHTPGSEDVKPLV